MTSTSPIDTVTFTLANPVTHGKKTHTTLTLRRVKVKDLSAGERASNEIQKTSIIFAGMAGVPLAVIEELDMSDFIALATLAEPLLDAVGVTIPD